MAGAVAFPHIIIYAGRGNLANKLFLFAWPRRRVRTIDDSLLRPSRRLPIALAHVRWANHDGELVLAPPLLFGGEVGDHLIFHWRASGVDHVVAFIHGRCWGRPTRHSRPWSSRRADAEQTRR